MVDRILAAGLLAFCCAFPSSLFGQAAAEYGALAGSSASAAVKAGTALRRGTSRLVRRMQQATSRPTQATVRDEQRKRGAKHDLVTKTVHAGSAREMPTVSLVGDKDGCTSTTVKTSSRNRASGLLSRDCKREASNRKTQGRYPSTVSISFGH